MPEMRGIFVEATECMGHACLYLGDTRNRCLTLR